MNIPECIFNKIMLYNSHPIADMITHDWNSMVLEGYGQTWDEFVMMMLAKHKDKCRKKPKHCKLMKEEIRRFNNRQSFRKQDNLTLFKSFYEFYTTRATN